MKSKQLYTVYIYNYTLFTLCILNSEALVEGFLKQVACVVVNNILILEIEMPQLLGTNTLVKNCKSTGIFLL